MYSRKFQTLIRFDNKLGWMQRWPIDSRELLKEDNVEMPPMNVMIGQFLKNFDFQIKSTFRNL